MKKCISMMLVLVMSAVLLVGCGSGAAGTYEAVKVEVNGEEMDLDSFPGLADEGFEATITLDKDGKAEMIVKVNGKEQTASGTWTEDDDQIIIKNDNGQEQAYEKKDGHLLIEYNGVKLILEK